MPDSSTDDKKRGQMPHQPPAQHREGCCRGPSAVLECTLGRRPVNLRHVLTVVIIQLLRPGALAIIVWCGLQMGGPIGMNRVGLGESHLLLR
jgi:hypothetical protein